jgi:hypothetical protein
MDTNGREGKKGEPQMDPPSREAMAGKLQIRRRQVERCLAREADLAA